MLSKRPRVQAEVMLQTASWQNKMFSLHNHFQSQLFASSVFLELFYWAIEDLKLIFQYLHLQKTARLFASDVLALVTARECVVVNCCIDLTHRLASISAKLYMPLVY